MTLKRLILWTLGLALAALLLAGAALAVFVARFDAEGYKPLAIEWMKSRYDRVLAIDGPVRLSVFPRLGVGVSGVSLSQPRVGTAQPAQFARIDAAELSLELLPLLRGEVKVGRVTARGVRLAYARDAQGRSNIDDLLAARGEPPSAGAPSGSSGGLSALDIAGIDLQDAQVRVNDALAGVQGTLTLAKLQSGRMAPGVETPLQLQAELDLSQPAVRGGLRGATRLRLAEPAATGAPTALGATLGETTLAFTGTAAGLRLSKAEIGLTGTASQPGSRTVELQGLTLAVELAGREGTVQSLTLGGTASAAPGQIAWDVQGRWRAPGNDSTLASRGRYALDTGSVQATAQLAALDLDALQGRPGTAGSGAAPAARAPTGTAPADDTPLDFGAARAFKGRVDASLGTLVARRIRFTDLRVVLQGDGRVLDARPFSAQVWNGRIEGQAQVRPDADRLQLSAQASGIRIEQALRDLAARENVQGVGRVDVDVSATGKTVNQLKSQLAGRAAVQLRDGAVRGFNLAELGRRAKAALSLGKDETETARATAQTDFTEIAASFVIAQGVARSSDLSAKSPYLRATGEGAIDLARSRIDYTVFATLIDTSKGQGGADLARLEGVRVPVRLSGPLDAIEYQVQWSAVGGDLVRQEAKRRLEEKLGVDAGQAREALKDKAREKLKGLFR